MLLRLVFILAVLSQIKCKLIFSNHVLTMAVEEVATFKTNNVSDEKKNKNVTFFLEALNSDIIEIMLKKIQVNSNFTLKLKGLKAGQTEIYVTQTPKNSTTKSTDNDFLLVKIYKNLAVEWISSIIGWLYFSAWTISFYPQLYTNYKRKSVVGLNFDWLLFNIIGYIMYNSFNMSLFLVPKIKEQYSLKHPGSLNPVQANDLFFSAHGVLATLVMIFQCFIYERGNQSISIIAKIIVTIYFVVTIVYGILASMAMVLWLDVLYVCSYIKLSITVTKYVPQAYMNYKRKSTQGFNIGGVLLDFIGGVLSILQMFLDGYNYDDWAIIIGNPTKFGLGILTIGFDLVFIFQHYFLYSITTSSITKPDIKLNTYTLNKH